MMTVLAALAVMSGATGLSPAPPAPDDFKSFPVKQVYRGPLHPPDLDPGGPPESLKNWAIARDANRPADFAGRYRVVKFSCGSECTGYVITDVVSGKRVA